MTLDYDERLELDSALRFALEEWVRTREEYWAEGVAEDHMSSGQLADDLAEAVLAGIDGLIRPRAAKGISATLLGKGFKSLSDLFKIKGLRELGLERIEIELASRYSIYPRSMADRALDLAEFVLEDPPSPAVAKYLARLSKSYVLGLSAETIILCRSVLENAVSSWFERKKHAAPETMRSKLQWMVLCGALSSEEESTALSIWHRGNTAVHKDPGATSLILETVSATMEIVRSVESV